MAIKIQSVKVRRVKMERIDPTWKTASHAASYIDGFILEVVADRTVGIGGTAAHPRSVSADKLEVQLNGPVRDALVGADVLAGNEVRNALRIANIHTRALVAADLALHDLIGKLAGLPCYALWGGAVRSEMSVVRMVGLKPPAELEVAALALLKEGYRHLKVKIGSGVAEDLERIQVLRRAIGDDIWIGVDANGVYTPAQAIELSHGLEQYGVAFLEQPTHYADLDGLAQVTEASAVPIMADQCVSDAASALSLCKRQAAHIVSVKATKMGTLDECRRVAEICHAFGIRVHGGGSVVPSVVDAALAQLVASLPEFEKECEAGESQAVTGDITNGLTIREGRIEIGAAPGLGISVATG
ncbi:mandelate racemase/muconate lactonizing enzyme family protein [Thermodesulfobacteriota bacterium]